MKTPDQTGVGGSIPASPLQQMHDIAEEHFKANPLKCYQRHIRELYAAKEKIPGIASLDGAVVGQVSIAEAQKIILKYEWLRTMAMGTAACYGLKFKGELLGVACFSRVGVKEICGTTKRQQKKFLSKTIYLARGACVPHAPKNAASFLIRQSCYLARQQYGWQIFFAYSDKKAGEIGTVYQASNWFHLGAGLGQSYLKHHHADYVRKEKSSLWPKPLIRLSSYKINHKRLRVIADINRELRRQGITSGFAPTTKGEFRGWLRTHGWEEIRNLSFDKRVYVWFEGSSTEKQELKTACRWPIHPYPKRSTQEHETPSVHK